MLLPLLKVCISILGAILTIGKASADVRHESISMVLRKLATFRYSVYIEECCERLSKTSAHPTDRYIPAVIQLQHILEKIDRVSVQTSHGVIIPDQSIELQVMGLRSELEAFKEKLPFAMWESGKSTSVVSRNQPAK